LITNNQISPGAYSISKAENGDKQLLVFNQTPPPLRLVGLSESEPLLISLQKFFRQKIGLEIELTKDKEASTKALAEKDYSIVLLPITYTTQDLASVYSETGRDISEIRRSRLANPVEFENSLSAYTLSNYTDNTAKEQLVKYFSEQFISLNLYQTSTEYSYSKKIAGIKDTLPDHIVFPSEIYFNIHNWYVQTDRKII
jgi:hypothetical protein